MNHVGPWIVAGAHLATAPTRRLRTPSPPTGRGVWGSAIFQPSVTQTAKAIRLPSPEGRFENSPPFQGWDYGIEVSSPEGTAESPSQTWSRKRRMTFGGFNRPFGTHVIANVNPAVNCRAILNSPSGRRLPAPPSWRRSRAGATISSCALATARMLTPQCRSRTVGP